MVDYRPIMKGDRVSVMVAVPYEGMDPMLEGVVRYAPGGEGDAWAIQRDDGTVVNVQRYEWMERVLELEGERGI